MRLTPVTLLSGVSSDKEIGCDVEIIKKPRLDVAKDFSPKMNTIILFIRKIQAMNFTNFGRLKKVT